jgi:hypothetical protein
MAIFTFRGTFPKIDEGIAQLFVQRWLQAEAKRAIQEFLKAALPLIPVRTGFLSGSMAGLTRYFGAPQSEQLSTKVISIFRGGTAKREYYYPRSGGRILKTPYSGLGLVTRPEQVARVGADHIAIEMEVDIDYYAVNETHWHSIEKGTQALLASLESATDRFPRLDTIVSQVSVSY